MQVVAVLYFGNETPASKNDFLNPIDGRGGHPHPTWPCKEDLVAVIAEEIILEDDDSMFCRITRLWLTYDSN